MDELASKILDCILDNQGDLDTDMVLMALGKVTMGVAESAHNQRNEDNIYLRN